MNTYRAKLALILFLLLASLAFAGSAGAAEKKQKYADWSEIAQEMVVLLNKLSLSRLQKNWVTILFFAII